MGLSNHFAARAAARAAALTASHTAALAVVELIIFQ